jgi:hypothetical protein
MREQMANKINWLRGCAGGALALGLMAGGIGQAHASGPDAYPVSAPQYRTLVVETVFPYAVAKYTPPVAMPAAAVDGTPRSTPESVLFQMAAAMQAADYDRAIALWTPESQQLMHQREQASGQGKQHWQQLWRSTVRKNYQLLSRVSYGNYVLIEYQYQLGPAATVVTDTMALEQRDGSWYLTQALAADPMLLHWNNPAGRVQVLPDCYLSKPATK